MSSPTGAEIDVISRQIANAHTCFNVAMTLIWLPLIPLMVKIVMKILPEKGEDLAVSGGALDEPAYLAKHLRGQPAAAMQLGAQEVLRYGRCVSGVLENLITAARNRDVDLLSEVGEQASSVHNLGTRITDYLAELFSLGVLTEEQATRIAGLMRVQNDIAHMDALAGGIAGNLAENAYSDKAFKSLRRSLEQIEGMLSGALQAMEDGDAQAAARVLEMREKVLNLDIDMRKEHMKRVAKGECLPERTEPYNDILFGIDRLGNACVNVAEAASGPVDYAYFMSVIDPAPEDDRADDGKNGGALEDDAEDSAFGVEGELQPAR